MEPPPHPQRWVDSARRAASYESWNTSQTYSLIAIAQTLVWIWEAMNRD